MPTIEPLFHLLDINAAKFSKEEHILLEAELFMQICKEIKEIFRSQYKEYFRLMKFTVEMENKMIESNFLRLVINDILSSNEYTLEGIAHYTDTHMDVIHEVASGCNTMPSALLLQRTIDLHRSVRGDVYRAIMKKVISENSAQA